MARASARNYLRWLRSFEGLGDAPRGTHLADHDPATPVA
jgi:hypothetical protein